MNFNPTSKYTNGYVTKQVINTSLCSWRTMREANSFKDSNNGVTISLRMCVADTVGLSPWVYHKQRFQSLIFLHLKVGKVERDPSLVRGHVGNICLYQTAIELVSPLVSHCDTDRKQPFLMNPIHYDLSPPQFFFLWRCDPTRVIASSFLRFLDHTQRRTTVG